MLFLFAFLLAMAGFAMLVAGEFTWRGGKKISARTSRQAGGVFVSLLPIALIVGMVLSKVDPHQSVHPALVQGGLALVWFVTGSFILWRELRSQSNRNRRIANSVGANPFGESGSAGADPGDKAHDANLLVVDQSVGVPASPPEAASKTKSRTSESQVNPFDF